jgi:hypothetical protein
MPNDNVLIGISCPNCKSEGPFDIDCTARFTVWDDGTNLEYGVLDWEDNSLCSCKNCGFKGKVYNFKYDSNIEPDVVKYVAKRGHTHHGIDSSFIDGVAWAIGALPADIEVPGLAEATKTASSRRGKEKTWPKD